jgi:hypothetical protein
MVYEENLGSPSATRPFDVLYYCGVNYVSELL